MAGMHAVCGDAIFGSASAAQTFRPISLHVNLYVKSFDLAKSRRSGGYLGFCHAYVVECRHSLAAAGWMKIYSGDCASVAYIRFTSLAGSLAPPWNVTNDSVQYIEFLLCRIKRARALHCWYFHSIMQRARVFSIYFINILSAALLDSIPNSISF
jgi:hypothetical protein